MSRNPKTARPKLSESWDDVADSIGGNAGREEGIQSGDAASGVKPGRATASQQLDSATTSGTGRSNVFPTPSDSPATSRPRRPVRPSTGTRGSEPSSSPSPAVPRRRSARNSRAPSVEATVPELVYPSIDGSWIDAESPGTRRRGRQPPRITEEQDSLDSQPSTPSPRRRKKNRSRNDPSKPPSAAFGIVWEYFFAPILTYLGIIFGLVMHWLAPVVALILATGIAIFVSQLALSKLIFTFGLAVPSLSNITSPCSLPVISSLPFCQNPTAAGRPEFEELVKVQASFEDVLQSTAHNVKLPLDMKRSEASIRDLRSLVDYSHLPSKNELVYMFEEFISTARQASADLTKFSSRINRATDHIISTNRYTLQVLDSYTSYELSRGYINRVMSSLSLTKPLHTEASILKQYLRHAESVEDEIVSLIDQAQVLLAVLQGMDNHLDAIHGICTRDGIRVQESLDELFASIWTHFGANRSSRDKLDRQLRLLKDVGAYSKLAWAHVSATILKLQQIQAGLEDLRERVVMPDTLPDIPLQQHINTIQLGVQRLEDQRNEARRLETDTYRRIMDRPDELDKSRLVDGKPR